MSESVRPIEEEFAVVVAALLAGRIDGQRAVQSLAALHKRYTTVVPDRAQEETACEFESAIRDQTHDHWCRVHEEWRDDHPAIEPYRVCSCIGRMPPHKATCPLAPAPVGGEPE